MSAVPYVGFALVATLAVVFAAAPLFGIGQRKTRALLLAGLALFVIGVGGGTYYLLGRPQLAQRDASGLDTREVSGLIPFLIQRVRQFPTDTRAWRYLGEAYMAAKDPRNAAKAYGKVIELTGQGDAALNASYGEALVAASNGAVPPEAEKAFAAALAIDPTSAPARFYLGLAKADRKDAAGAIELWQSLLADIPVTSPLRQVLVDRIALLTSQTAGPGAKPNPRAMVDMLAARLKADPNDALGWVRLMRAYTVLGETEKAKQALSDARKAFPGNKDAETAFATAAKTLKIE